ncbi:nuclease [Peribacillus asahii]|uniref:Nuclease n=1 Tax=Peribacillus asahii TaxID=228899 RepID=A0A3Q9RM66_9BACI|nr:endonuclease NucS domain-containing protein [Peribacillus asahii]AZV42005.1 nuclease [Peribacillus asahii]
MHILSEKEFEDILVLHPELIEDNLTLIKRQGQLQEKRTDLMFKDKLNNLLLVELKRDRIEEENIHQIMGYIRRLKALNHLNVRGMLIGQSVPLEIQEICRKFNIEWKEIKNKQLYDYLSTNNIEMYNNIFIKEKIHLEAKKVKTLSFQDYLDETSPLRVPYSSYQFFLPQDASPELSKDNHKNQLIADEFIKLIQSSVFHRTLFNGAIVLKRLETKPRWVEKNKGDWKGYIFDYILHSEDYSKGIPCELYLGQAGYRGNKPTYADGRSRFMAIDIGNSKNKASTQYGFHKYLRVDNRALLPFYELKFSAGGLPKQYWDEIYKQLDKFSYKIQDSPNSNKIKCVYIGDIKLESENILEEIDNLIEVIFAVTIVKAHYKKNGFPFSIFI